MQPIHHTESCVPPCIALKLVPTSQTSHGSQHSRPGSRSHKKYSRPIKSKTSNLIQSSPPKYLLPKTIAPISGCM
ncbi:hypothetical protein M378DRAFT_854227 [Amanita muscaria Koide BX008]|uniref:Uncharacterized protein n=1 Tax=Amanita muscaria (strain Koide BX008) TaxID=946122 RepID=A0A0C2WJ60_AMAMK|nr:hypothetical protein M378DRAFT_854227 [Amanita muscaria Koide BX008]